MTRNNRWRRRIIRLLEHVLEDLQRRPPSLEQAAIVDKLAALSNRADSMFEGLEPVEVTESLYYTRQIEIPHKEDHTRYRLKDCAEDTAFALYCFMQDATYLRLFSIRAWHEFAIGQIGIHTATFCMNSADAQIRDMTEELLDTFDYFDDTWTTRMHPKIDAFMRQHCGNDALVAGIPLDKIKPDCEDVTFARHATRRLGFYACTLMCVNTTRLLFEAFLGDPGRYLGANLDEMCLLKSLYQLRCLEWLEDEVSSDIKLDCTYRIACALVLGHIDTDAVFAAQMLLDIQQQVSPRIISIDDILNHITQDYLDLYQAYRPAWDNERLMASRPWTVQRMCKQYSRFDKLAEHPQNIIIQEVMEHWEHATGRNYTIPGFRLTQYVPSLIGQRATLYRIRFQIDFMHVVNETGHVLTAIHLYNAARNSGALQLQRWEDMEWFMDHQSLFKVFAGEPPAANILYACQFCLAYGLDAAKFAVNRRPAVMRRVKNDIYIEGVPPRGLESCSQLVRISDNNTTYPQPRSILKTTEELAKIHLNVFSPYGTPNKMGILIAAKESHESDDEALSFDIFKFHLKCAQLLTNIRDLCLKEAPDDYPTMTFGGEDGINPTIAELLRDLTDSPRCHGRMWPKAVKLLDNVIQREGSECLDMAFERMKMTTLDPVHRDSGMSSSDPNTPQKTSPRTSLDGK
ncbi:hypothetical protein C7974DRAFT_442497 [Boeremia exigua]|uniref:uncharacterized protein n=1 Tax=Boeremia exigua TaxID=749465 RepID=UPI001E8D930E|nr:uncharacterized protein C7974DRAFT_442497 [Boeremia exigua]KAH6616697.1 hypothetical protein C7974DRAFT_442497 [Boeremia exigua]